VGSELGISTEKLNALHDYAKSPLFNAAERVALEYADAMTDTASDVDDALFARVRQHYDEEQIAELTMLIAWECIDRRDSGRVFGDMVDTSYRHLWPVGEGLGCRGRRSRSCRSGMSL
jgi:hypothetical protein